MGKRQCWRAFVFVLVVGRDERVAMGADLCAAFLEKRRPHRIGFCGNRCMLLAGTAHKYDSPAQESTLTHLVRKADMGKTTGEKRRKDQKSYSA